MLKAEEQMELAEKARGQHPGAVAVDGTVAQHGSAVFARWRCGGQA